MKAEELMVGDWVKFKGSDLAHRVFAIAGKSIRVDKGNWYSAKTFVPIPLTAEILEQNGFDKKWHDRNRCTILDQKNDNVTLIVYDHYNATISIDDLPFNKVNKENQRNQRTEAVGCRYVHELQHILRMFGIEKSIFVTSGDAISQTRKSN